jgi:hypothetical protein
MAIPIEVTTKKVTKHSMTHLTNKAHADHWIFCITEAANGVPIRICCIAETTNVVPIHYSSDKAKSRITLAQSSIM